ncbi:MAG TPA: response regulator [bacterium]|nr:response regulator [bacterium]
MARVLIVDDAIFMRRMLSDIVRGAGHEVAGEAGDAIEAIKKYEELRPDVVTMDIVMPRQGDMDGMGALKRILEIDPAARIVMVSALGQQETVLEAIRIGAKDFIVKPFLEENVVKAIDRVAKEAERA